jgi:hypothetical protein
MKRVMIPSQPLSNLQSYRRDLIPAQLLCRVIFPYRITLISKNATLDERCDFLQLSLQSSAQQAAGALPRHPISAVEAYWLESMQEHRGIFVPGNPLYA